MKTITTPWITKREGICGPLWTLPTGKGLCNNGVKDLFNIPNTAKCVRFVLTDECPDYPTGFSHVLRLLPLRSNSDHDGLYFQSLVLADTKGKGGEELWYRVDDGGLLDLMKEMFPLVARYTVTYWGLYCEIEE
jgi:hypothetical protein